MTASFYDLVVITAVLCFAGAFVCICGAMLESRHFWKLPRGERKYNKSQANPLIQRKEVK